MPAYVIATIKVQDPATYEEYKKTAGASLSAFGGEFLVRGGQVEKLEGDWGPERMIVVRFESLDQAKAWWASAEYAGAKEIRQRAALTDMVVVEGVPA